MAFKMKGFPMQNVSALKNKIKENKFNVDKLADKDDQRFLDKQKEERVKYSELDAEGKAIYNKNRQKSGLAPLKQDKKLQGPKTDGNIKLQPSENPDVAVTGGKGSSLYEKIADYEDRIEFLNEKYSEYDRSLTNQEKKDLAKLKQELAILKRNTKKVPFKKKNTYGV